MIYFFTLNNLLNHLNWYIQTAKYYYQNKFRKEISDPIIRTNCFRSLVKNLVNAKKIPSTFTHVSCFKMKSSGVNNTIVKIISKFILNKTIICND